MCCLKKLGTYLKRAQKALVDNLKEGLKTLETYSKRGVSNDAKGLLEVG